MDFKPSVRKVRIALLIMSGVLGCSQTFANDLWLSSGLGAGSDGLAIHSNISLQVTSHTLLSMRYAHTWSSNTVNGGGFLSGGQSFHPGIRDYGILFGFIATNEHKKTAASASLGVGSVTVTEKGEWVDNTIFNDFWRKRERSATGLLLQGQLFANSIGIQAFGDINSIRSFGGIVISYRLFTSF